MRLKLTEFIVLNGMMALWAALRQPMTASQGSGSVITWSTTVGEQPKGELFSKLQADLKSGMATRMIQAALIR
jgi:hypothetical protein